MSVPGGTERATVRDRGLQAERTALAWSRTALALAGVSILVGRTLAVVFGVWVAVLAAIGILTSAAAMRAAHRRYRHWAHTSGYHHRSAAGTVALGGTVTLLGLAALATHLAVLF